MEGEKIFEGTTEKEFSVLVRYPTIDDVEIMMNFINEVSSEQTFVRPQGEQYSFEKEKEFVETVLKGISDNKTVYLLAFSNGQLAGSCSLTMKDRIEKHEGTFGLIVAKEHRGKGLGKLLTKLVLEEAMKNIPALKIVTLGVFGNNPNAIEMYKKFGFIEHGKLPEGILHKGNFVDHIFMYKKVRD